MYSVDLACKCNLNQLRKKESCKLSFTMSTKFFDNQYLTLIHLMGFDKIKKA